jgi:hypothetical protein
VALAPGKVIFAWYGEKALVLGWEYPLTKVAAWLLGINPNVFRFSAGYFGTPALGGILAHGFRCLKKLLASEQALW